MTIDELIARLEDYRDEIGGDAEVRLMTQQNWPFENTICGLCSNKEISESGDGDEQDQIGYGTKRACGVDDGDNSESDASVVYIVEQDQIGYGTKRAWDVARR
jgi:hypothetical protein